MSVAISFDGELLEDLLLIWERSDLELCETRKIYTRARHAPARGSVIPVYVVVMTRSGAPR